MSSSPALQSNSIAATCIHVFSIHGAHSVISVTSGADVGYRCTISDVSSKSLSLTGKNDFAFYALPSAFDALYVRPVRTGVRLVSSHPVLLTSSDKSTARVDIAKTYFLLVPLKLIGVIFIVCYSVHVSVVACRKSQVTTPFLGTCNL